MRSSLLLVVPLATGAIVVGFAACGGDDSSGPASHDGGGDGAVTTEGGQGDGGSGDDGPSGATGFHDVSDGAQWTAFDLTTKDPDFANYTGFFGGAFDGRYVYLAPYQRGVAGDASAGLISGRMIRVDTQGDFASPGAWSEFDIPSAVPNAQGFMSSAFDGRYLYLLPGPASSIMARYDTQAPFDQPGSWTGSQPLDTQGYCGVAFDGHALYTGPIASPGALRRHDTSGAVDAGWTTFDPTTLTPAGSRVIGSVFDGRYVYFGPGTNVAAPNGVITRYDSQGPFDQAGSWKTFDIASLTQKVLGFAGGTFDGRYVYFASYYAQGMPTNVIPRYDTQAPFDQQASWQTFDTTPLTPQGDIFFGTIFDGRYVYFIPWLSDQLQRYDTSKPFGDPASWTVFHTKTVHPKGERFRGAVFDGRYIYLVPSEESVVLRFDARNPPAMPPSYHGSFL